MKTGLLICVATLLTVVALLVPSHLRSVDESVLEHAGVYPDSIDNKIWEAINAAHTGPAKLYAQATGHKTPNQQNRIHQLLSENPLFSISGGPDRDFEEILQQSTRYNKNRSAISALLPRPERKLLSERLSTSRNQNVRALLNIRNLTGLTRLHPQDHPAGAPYDAGVLTLALLIEGDHFQPRFSQEIGNLATLAVGNNPEATIACENLVIATLSLGHSLDYRSLASLAKLARTLSDWSQMATLFRVQPDHIAELYTALRFSETPETLYTYLAKHKETGMRDLKFSLQQSPEAVTYLIKSGKPIYQTTSIAEKILDRFKPYRPQIFTLISHQQHLFGQLIKFMLLIFAGFVFSLALMHVRRRNREHNDTTTNFSPISITRDLLVSCIFALTVWTFFEPDILKSKNSLTENNPRIEFALTDTFQSLQSSITAMQELNQATFLVLVLFFVLQLVIYSFCLIKLGEIRKQSHTSKIKLKLLDNEENLFDFGLYVGLGGTVLSLILVAIGIIEASLMAAYASTLFGILFTAALKVLHVRPYRRKLILETHS